jgi:hypothetical protein
LLQRAGIEFDPKYLDRRCSTSAPVHRATVLASLPGCVSGEGFVTGDVGPAVLNHRLLSVTPAGVVAIEPHSDLL